MSKTNSNELYRRKQFDKLDEYLKNETRPIARQDHRVKLDNKSDESTSSNNKTYSGSSINRKDSKDNDEYSRETSLTVNPANTFCLISNDSAASLINDLRFLLESDDDLKNQTDLIFEFNDGRIEIPLKAHQSVFLARSKWYGKSYSKYLSKKEDTSILNNKSSDNHYEINILFKSIDKNNLTFQIENVSPDAFIEFIKFVYTAVCDINEFNLIDILKCAIGFEVNSLIRSICEYLVGSLNAIDVEKLVKLYRLSAKARSKALEAKCIELINENAETIIHNEEWQDLVQNKSLLVVNAFYNRAN